jgi:hypothetical protein
MDARCVPASGLSFAHVASDGKRNDQRAGSRRHSVRKLFVELISRAAAVHDRDRNVEPASGATRLA